MSLNSCGRDREANLQKFDCSQMMHTLRKNALLLLSILASSVHAAEIPQLFLTKFRLVSEVTLVGNYKTKREVIFSELLFKEGDYIENSELLEVIQRSKENLQNTSLFNRVEITYYFPTINTIEINIKVEERWYLWIFPLFEAEGRNFADFLRTNDGGNFNYGIYLKHANFSGRRDQLKLRFITGYRTQAILEYLNPAQNQKSGWGAKAIWYMYDKMAYSTVDDQQVFLKTSSHQLLREMSLHWSYNYRYHLDHYHNVTFSYYDISAADSLLILNPEYLPDGKTEARTLDVQYVYSFDRRDSKTYPLNGYNSEFSFSRRGLTTSGDYAGFTRIELEASYQMPLLSRFYGKSDIKASFIDQNRVPYFYRSGLGYNEYINGFEYRVIDGTTFGALKNKLLFELLPRRDLLLNWMPLKQFSRIYYALYLKGNLDVGYVYNKYPDSKNHMANSFLLGYGFGLDLVTFYDQIWSINYSFNNFGDRGFYFHLNLVL